jgi:hypothetical protein
MGRAAGPPWRQDEKGSALVAWMALAAAANDGTPAARGRRHSVVPGAGRDQTQSRSAREVHEGIEGRASRRIESASDSVEPL